MLIIGVDAHKRLLAAVAVDERGREQAPWREPNRFENWAALLAWATERDPERHWGIEGAGQDGRGLAQYLVAAGEVVVEVNPRQTAAMRRKGRRPGKTDRLDALAVARVVLQEGAALPRVPSDDVTTVLAVLVGERERAVRETTRLRNQLHQVLFQLDPQYHLHVPSLTDAPGVASLTTYASPSPQPLDQARAVAVRRLAARLALAMEQSAAFKAEIEALARVHCQPLIVLSGVEALTAGMLAAQLGAGARFTSDAQLALHAGVAPLEASSGDIVRHRLNRGGNRALNALFHRMARHQRIHFPPARAYLARRRAAGNTELEALRALKRFIARAVWRAWQACPAAWVTAPDTRAA